MEHNASIDDIGDFLEKYGKNKKVKLLDIGCSDGGKVFKFLDKKVFSEIVYMGLDSVYWDNDKNLQPVSLGKRQFIYGDACNLPFLAGEFNFIILSHVFEHIEDSEKLCFEINRVINKKGKVLVIVPLEKGGVIGFINKNRNLWRYFRVFLSLLKILPYHAISPHVRFKSYKEYLMYFEKRFKVIESYTRGSFGMLVISVLHENLMGFGRQKINLMEIVKNNFPGFFRKAYRKNKNFKMDAVFILEPKQWFLF